MSHKIKSSYVWSWWFNYPSWIVNIQSLFHFLGSVVVPNFTIVKQCLEFFMVLSSLVKSSSQLNSRQMTLVAGDVYQIRRVCGPTKLSSETIFWAGLRSDLQLNILLYLKYCSWGFFSKNAIFFVVEVCLTTLFLV